MKLFDRLLGRNNYVPGPAGEAPPAPTACISPEVMPDRRVKFRVHAPRARHVTLEGLPGVRGQPMSRLPDGVWHATVGPLRPGIYTYYFKVDSAVFTDPRNRNTQRWLVSNSVVEVPGDGSEMWALRRVPHGAVHRHRYSSTGRGRESAFQVYTPPGYRDGSSAPLPAVYLLHGFGDDERAWEEIGRAACIADNLIAAGVLRPCIVVMPHGHPIPISGPATDAYFENNAAAMERELVEEIVPVAEALYRIRSSPTARSVAGLSMGGGHALRVGLRRPDLFGTVAAFSSKPPLTPLDDLLRNTPGQAGNPARDLLSVWIACGQEDYLFAENQRFVASLQAHAVKHAWHPGPGGHDWSVWREYLAQAFPVLVRPSA
ncbi:alpha/beta hydrolase-fold protein [Opitutales bacterium ASA1]|jgi:enterochelin esterase family protein|uniref:alpha/beta hydrolase-fold protein n=1 Tax=Congregicoccus parvus TaxID=3081749 RepID=UPI002B295821|nr:alpha/beta hydrolase-fold protein [Opitutales bacterium ASA1]